MSDEREPDEAFLDKKELEAAYDPSVGDGTPNTAPERMPVDDDGDSWELDDPWDDEDDGDVPFP